VKTSFKLFLSAAMLLGIAAISLVEAKGLSLPIGIGLTFRPIEAVIRAQVVPGGNPEIMVTQSYLGPYKIGDRITVDSHTFQKSILLAGVSQQPDLLLFLAHTPHSTAEDSNSYFANGLEVDIWLSKRISNGRIYLWYPNPKTVSYFLYYLFTNTASLVADEEHANQTALESDMAEGLSRRDQFHRAKEAIDPALKLSLLRPFLIPGGNHHFTTYEVWSASSTMLQEAEKTGPASIPFFTDLLTLPEYQDEYAPDGWKGWGAQERALVKESLTLEESLAATDAKEKLKRLRPLFDLPHYFTYAGYDPHGVVETYLDRGLAAATAAGPQEAIPFLQGLLELPQFQKGYSPIGSTSFGEEDRVKIEAVIAGLQKASSSNH
jgi:hypothetical protein